MRHSKNVPLSALLVLAGVTLACGGNDNRTPTSPTPPPVINPKLTVPTPETPDDNEQLSTLRPTFEVINGASDQPGTRTYEFQISDRSDFSTAVASVFGNAIWLS